MGAHETLEASLAAVETDAIRLRAARLVAQFNAACGLATEVAMMSRADWVEWEGLAYGVLREVARG